MKLIPAFLRLVRWPNLVFIVLTQALFYYCIVVPLFKSHGITPILTYPLFWLLSLASVLIAAAGYIINDYFDLNIDRVNKPDKLVVDKVIKRRWAIMWHLILSAIGLGITLWVGWRLYDIYAALAVAINFFCVGALWLYSTTYKRKLLIGNLLISLLTAWTILILYVINIKSWYMTKVMVDYKDNYNKAVTSLFKLSILYAGFAFIISLIREVVKDMEDMEGDARYGCRTMPIVWGIPVSKVFTAVWIVVLIAALVIVQFYMLHFGWWVSAIYGLLFVIAPLVWLLNGLYKANTPAAYHRLSSVIKLIMLAGILSILFFYWYYQIV